MAEDKKRLILVVDDTEAGRYTTSKTLRSEGFEVIEAATGRESLEMALKLPDLIILDVQLPDKSGFEVCTELKSGEKTQYIPVIHLSATYVDAPSKAKGLNTGADGYLVHPVESIELVATVNAMLRMKDAEKKAREAVKERDETIKKLEDALAQIKTLKGILPICSYCKKIRNDKSCWEQLEMYIRDHSEAEFSHGMCPACAEKAFKEAEEFLKRIKE